MQINLLIVPEDPACYRRDPGLQKCESLIDLTIPDAAKKRRLDNQSEGNRPETNSSEKDKNNEADQIPEVAAKVITKWFKDHQGVKYF